MATPLRKQIAELQASVEYWKDKCHEKDQEVSNYKRRERDRDMEHEVRENEEIRMLKTVNERLWYLVRHYAGDTRIPTTRKDWNGPGGEETTIDPFHL